MKIVKQEVMNDHSVQITNNGVNYVCTLTVRGNKPVPAALNKIQYQWQLECNNLNHQAAVERMNKLKERQAREAQVAAQQQMLEAQRHQAAQLAQANANAIAQQKLIQEQNQRITELHNQEISLRGQIKGLEIAIATVRNQLAAVPTLQTQIDLLTQQMAALQATLNAVLTALAGQ
jgi:uncharacterized sporulation protein YeaH/YhbH (DUF444 family)